MRLARSQVHVAERGLEVLVAGELLDRYRRRASHREVRAERVPQEVEASVGLQLRPPLRSGHPLLDHLGRRAELDLTQEQAAERAHIEAKHWQDLEAMRAGNPTLATLLAVARALKVDLTALLSS
jgi:hypothetical protein